MVAVTEMAGLTLHQISDEYFFKISAYMCLNISVYPNLYVLLSNTLRWKDKNAN